MKNAHLRFGKVSFCRVVGKSLSNFSLHMDRFIGEQVSGGVSKAHLLSVVGGDAQVAGAAAMIAEQEPFTMEGPDCEPMNVNMGRDAQCYRASIQLPGVRRPVRHLVAVSQEFEIQASSRASPRVLLALSSPDAVWSSVAQIFGLPAIPDWAGWFYKKLGDNLCLEEIVGVGCQPIAIAGTKNEFLGWLSEGIKKGEIEFPKENGPAVWPQVELRTLLMPGCHGIDDPLSTC